MIVPAQMLEWSPADPTGTAVWSQLANSSGCGCSGGGESRFTAAAIRGLNSTSAASGDILGSPTETRDCEFGGGSFVCCKGGSCVCVGSAGCAGLKEGCGRIGKEYTGDDNFGACTPPKKGNS